MRRLNYYVENKELFRREKKVNENKVLSYCEALRYMSHDEGKNNTKVISHLQTHYHLN